MLIPVDVFKEYDIEVHRHLLFLRDMTFVGVVFNTSPFNFLENFFVDKQPNVWHFSSTQIGRLMTIYEGGGNEWEIIVNGVNETGMTLYETTIVPENPIIRLEKVGMRIPYDFSSIGVGGYHVAIVRFPDSNEIIYKTISIIP